ncbi:WecB/TagA/CpsF family glycosyltransferase [Phytopseudomonas dryadis]|uniref:Glycosyltransferase n=1 Tax=Phytopseudomonas dryadis TaxID=2487520 RepID=A0A4Q9QYC8_9GAMM|nr:MULTISPECIES: WecB/TagA/CpsF family glycosyltransferase [Pseudomonas]TBU88178.1 glycosyltransferase [Pseudomonas dryadis]TBV05498.1 glycosyltransferase [Pseudomonas dryadis]TBV18508.1 glycosyltransferase [Pseudomonas sp. FRB 230]
MKAFDIEFYGGSKQGLIEDLADHSTDKYSYVVTPNVNHVVQLETDRNLKRAYAVARHRVCDSRVLLPMLRLLRVDVAEAIPGSTLTEELVQLAEERAWHVTVIGCEVDDMQHMRERYPHITFHHHNPPMGFIEDEQEVQACLSFVIDHPSNLVVLAVGCPRQEILALKILETDQAVGIGLCVGASINFLSGRTRRAPQWMQRWCLEWLHRAGTEPRRLIGRYARDAVLILPILFREFKLRQSLSMGGAPR